MTNHARFDRSGFFAQAIAPRGHFSVNRILRSLPHIDASWKRFCPLSFLFSLLFSFSSQSTSMEGGGAATVRQPSVCYTIEKIIGVSQGYGNTKTYQVQWTPTWVCSSHLVGCEKLLNDFLNQQHQDQGQDSTKHVTNTMQYNDQLQLDVASVSAADRKKRCYF